MRPLETLLGSLRACLNGFPDKRRGLNVSYGMGEIGMAVFSVFHMQSPSFLAHQRRFEQGVGRSNCESLYGISKIPSDNHIRDMLDGASPELLRPVFDEAVDQLEGTPGGLDVFRRLGGRVLIALDGRNTIVRRPSIAATARPGFGERAKRRGRNITTPCWARR